jgi:DNA-binding beta-propeller fold protein YncE
MDNIRVIGTSGIEGKSDNQFAQPRGIWIDLNYKEIYVCDCNNHRISVFSSITLAHIRQIGRGIQGTSLGCLNYAVGLCLDDSKHIYVADTNNHRIAVFHQLTGAQINTIGSQGTTPGKLSSPYGVCVDKSTGSLFVADYENHRIQVFNKDTGAYERMIGSYGSEPGQFNKPIVTCIDEDNGNLFVCDYANNRVQVFNKDTGIYIRQLGNGSSGLGSDALQGPRGICLDRGSKLLFISDRENNRIQIYNKNTFTFIRHFGVGPGLGPGQFNKPMELCLNPDEGTLLVVDGYNHRVQIIPIPELQVESLRIQKEKKDKMEREAKEKRRPRASNMAINTNLTKFTIVDNNIKNSRYTVQFEGTGRLFDLLLTHEEMIILNASLTKLKSMPPISISTVNNSNKISDEYHIIEEQSTLFLSLISNLSQQPNTIKYIVPSVLALHALLERQWKPINFSTQNYSTFLNLLFNATHSTTSITEKKNVINAILSILTASMEVSSSSLSLEPYDNIVETMFQILITEFVSHLVEYPTADKNCNLTDSSIMLAALSMISNIFIYEWFHIGSVTSSNNKNIKSKDNNNNNGYTRNAINLIFGTTFVSSIQKFFTSTNTLPTSSTSLIVDTTSNTGDINIFLKLTQEVLPLLEITFLAARGRRRKNLTENIQVELFKKAKTHLEKAKDEYTSIKKVIESKYGNPIIATSRGGRNIWRASETLKVGDLVDAIDKENIWYESYVVSITPAYVRVHFMGWGSKWDDDIPEKDIHKRIAPLNSKTKNWRGELFEGGLIEIKCNEDMVNQKWMWGRIVLLSMEEGWVEISYSFANETSIIKRADLFGETICPVGMHTKDRSKAASASVVKPMAKIENLIHQKTNSLSSDEQELFLDRNDSFQDGEVGNGIFSIIDNSYDNRINNTDINGPNLINSLDNCSIDDIVSNISITAFEIIMKEVAQVITFTVEDPTTIDSELYKLAAEILSILAISPFQHLLVTCFCRVVIVQCGIRSKILTSGFLENNPIVISNMPEAMEALSVFVDELSVLEDKYVTLFMKSIGNLLTLEILIIVIDRIYVTLTSCSFLINYIHLKIMKT